VAEDGGREDWDEMVGENRLWILPEAKVSMGTSSSVDREKDTSYIIKLWGARAEHSVKRKGENCNNVRYLR
jgi:hypothetical protein